MSIASVYEGRCLPDWCAEDKRRNGSVPEPRLSRSHFQRRDRRLPEPFFVDEQLVAGRDEPVDRKQFNYLSQGAAPSASCQNSRSPSSSKSWQPIQHAPNARGCQTGEHHFGHILGRNRGLVLTCVKNTRPLGF
jgi:hypothetical protein